MIEASGSVAIGDRLPTLVFDTSLRSLVMYAASTWDFHRYHYDSDYVQSIGLPAPFVDGQMLGALLSRQLMQWAGPDGFVRQMKYRLLNRVFVGEEIHLTGDVTDVLVKDGHRMAACDLKVLKKDGTSVVSGFALVELS